MRLFKILMSFFLLALLVFAPRMIRAQTYQQIMSGGRYTLPSGLTGVNVNILKGTFPAQGITTIQGTMNVVSNGSVANSNVSSATLSWVIQFGAKVKHAALVSKPMTYINLSNFSVTPAHVIIFLTQIGTYGQGGFQIISNTTGVILAQTSINGTFAELPFTSGYVSIGE